MKHFTRAAVRTITVVAVAAVVLTGIRSIPSSAQQSITVQQGWQPDLAAPLFYAQDKGLFTKHGLNVNFTRFNSGPAFFAALRSGSIDLADFTTSALASAVASHVPVKVFYVVADTGTTNVLVVQPGMSVKSAADLKGKTVASVNGSLPYYGLTKYLAASHMTVNDIKYLNLPPTSIIAAFKKHEIDAAYLWAPYFNDLVAAGGVPVTTTAKDGVGALDIWVANASWYDKNPEAVKRLIAAMSEAQQAVVKDPQAGLASLIKWGFDKSAAETDMKGTIFPSVQQQLDPKSPYALVPMNDSVVEKYTKDTADFFAQSGFIQPVSDWNGIFDAKPMQEVASAHR